MGLTVCHRDVHLGIIVPLSYCEKRCEAHTRRCGLSESGLFVALMMASLSGWIVRRLRILLLKLRPCRKRRTEDDLHSPHDNLFAIVTALRRHPGGNQVYDT
jgi:hypothetical protein